ncbi:MAG: cadmium-translocating P-type ATPase [Rhizobiaceae bacterium]|nr:cadmium-translocating P-type ATPase [Rhizobiaceae bacterium]
MLVDGAHCAACIATIETRLRRDPDVIEARLNLTLRRLTVAWRGDRETANRIAGMVEALGYGVAPFDPQHLVRVDDQTGRELLRAMAIAGFASSNVMMLSLAVWAGQAQDMPHGTQMLFQWLAALVTLPAVAVAGKPFFRSALQAVRARRTNIDVPIALGILLTTSISVIELARQGRDVYFDSAAALLFVLLVGRYLDFRVRARTRGAVERLLMLKAHGAAVVQPDGRIEVLTAEAVTPGMIVLVRAGERVPVDGHVDHGCADLEVSIVTGESLPRAVRPGDAVLAGSISSGILRVRATSAVEDSHLAEVVRLVEQAELQRGPAVTVADRVARIWTPVIHGIALLTLLGWWLLADATFATALLHAVSVLIIACPCAIGLAVPAVQVVAIGALLKRGILVRSGDALERLAAVDHVAFDKTGTLTEGRPRIVEWPDDPAAIRLAASLATASNHPAAQAILAADPSAAMIEGAVEHAGLGVSAPIAGGEARLGRAAFCGVAASSAGSDSEIWLSRPGHEPLRFGFRDPLRRDAETTFSSLGRQGFEPSLLSGDRQSVVNDIAAKLKIADARGELLPAGKLAALHAWRAEGRKVLMLGDGLNDAPGLAAAYVSASFTHGAPASQSAADIVLPSDRLGAIVPAWRMGRRATAIIHQNLVLAALYNIALIPIAVLGLVTPLGAAIAMAASSLTVTLNALRAGRLPAEATS